MSIIELELALFVVVYLGNCGSSGTVCRNLFGVFLNWLTLVAERFRIQLGRVLKSLARCIGIVHPSHLLVFCSDVYCVAIHIFCHVWDSCEMSLHMADVWTMAFKDLPDIDLVSFCSLHLSREYKESCFRASQ